MTARDRWTAKATKRQSVPRRRKQKPLYSGLPGIADLWEQIRIGAPDECWSWTGTTFRGYGHMRWGGRTHLAHRMVWRYTAGVEPPRSLVIMHTCDNPPCCNPAHLQVGTQGDNLRDRNAKRRANMPRGREHWTRRREPLTPGDVAVVWEMHGAGSTLREIGNRFGVVPQTIWHIVNGKTHKGSAPASMTPRPAIAREGGG